MESVSQERDMAQVQEALLHVLEQAAEELARPTGLIVRERKLSGPQFASLLVLGFLHNPQASLEELVQFAASLQINISSQALDQRFTLPAATFWQALFDVAISQVVKADPVAIPLLERFGAVILEDSTSCGLPDELAGLFEGCGGSRPQGTMAAFKVQVRLDMRAGQVQTSRLLDGRAADGATPLAKQERPARSLHVRDRGFFDLERIEAEQQAEDFHVTYYKTGVHLYTPDGQRLDLALQLRRHHEPREQEVLVGEHRVAMRLLAFPVPDEVAAQRRVQLARSAQRHSKAVNHEAFLLARWTLVLTNVPVALLSQDEALVLLKLRWQIELLFKLWKQHGLLDTWRSENPWRILCEVYAKLIGLLIQHWVLIISCWHEPHRSLVKAAKVVRSHAIMLAYALAGDLSVGFVLDKMERATHCGSRLNSRHTHPNTSQQLLDGLTWP